MPSRPVVAAVGAVVLGVAALSSGPPRGGPLPRGALWLVVRSCALARETLGTALPCLVVEPAAERAPGYAILRAPGSPTHVIATPTVPISGIESAAVLRPEAGAYWRAALAARRFVQDGASGPVPLGDIGLAINSERTRSQDQLHIHAECLAPPVLAAARAQDWTGGPGWQPLERPVFSDRFVGRRVSADEIGSGNVFAILSSLPGGRGDSDRQMGTIAAILVPAADERADGYILLASRARRQSIEELLDASCSAASGG